MKGSAPAPHPITVAPAEAARLLGISRTRLYELLDSGEIASFKTGHARLIPISTLHDWVARKLTAAQQ